MRKQPELDMQAGLCVRAWQDLDSDRPHGVRPMPVKRGPPILVPYQGAIPWTAIREYGEHHGLGREGIALLADVIGQQDFERAERESSELRSKK